MKLYRTAFFSTILWINCLSTSAQTDLCIDAFTNPFRSESFVQFSNGIITGITSSAGLEAGELAQPVAPNNDQVGEPVLFLGRSFENQNQNNLGGVLGGKRQVKFTRNSPNGNVSMTSSTGKLSSFNSLFGNGTVVLHYGKASDPLNLDLGNMPNPAFVLRNFTGTLAAGNTVLVKVTVTSAIGTAQHKTRTATHSISTNGDQIISTASPEFTGIDWSDVDRISLSLINSGSGGNQWEIHGFCLRSLPAVAPKTEFADAGMPTIYPVPASEILNIRFTAAQETSCLIEIHDLRGRLMHREHSELGSGAHAVQIEVGEWANGLYIVNTTLAGERTSQRIAVCHE